MLIRVILWLISYYGLCRISGRAFRAGHPYAPMIASSMIGCLLTIAGMLGVLFPMAVCLYALGFAGAVWSSIKWRKKCTWSHCACAVLVVLWAAFCLWKVSGASVHMVDDFAHWALAARHIVSSNALADSSMALLHFPSYPPGSAMLIYYFCRFTGNAEWMYLFGQAFHLIVFALPLIAAIRKNRAFGIAFMVCMFMVLQSLNIFIDNLQVDTLIALIGFGAFSVAWENRERPARALLFTLPCTVFLALIKNSGMFFAVIANAIIASGAWKKSKKRAACTGLIGVVAPLLAFILWQIYVRVQFPGAFETEHAVSVSSYLDKAEGVSIRFAAQIALSYISRLIHMSAIELALTAYAFGVPAVLWIYARKRQNIGLFREAGQIFIHQASAFIGYNLFLYFVYLFSMTTSEAQRLASFVRYYRTVTIYLSLVATRLLLTFGCGETSPFAVRKKYILRMTALVMAGVIAFAALCTESKLARYVSPFSINEMVLRINDLKAQNDIPDGGKLVVTVDAQKHTGNILEQYIIKMNHYKFDTLDLLCIIRTDESEDKPFRVYDRRDAVNDAGGVYYKLRDIPYENMGDAEVLEKVKGFSGDADGIVMIDEDEALEGVLKLAAGEAENTIAIYK